jgi:hypothetical protein
MGTKCHSNKNITGTKSHSNKMQCCGSGSSWICVQFALWIPIRLWSADPDPATLAPKAEIYFDLRSLKTKFFLKHCSFPLNHYLHAICNMQMIKIFSTKKKQNMLSAKGLIFIKKNYRKNSLHCHFARRS